MISNVTLTRQIAASVRRNGVMATLVLGFRRFRIVVGSLRDRRYDGRFGTDTAGAVELEDLAITSPNKTRGVRYEPTPADAFRKLMARVRLPRNGVFVDLGCGKGRVLLLAAELGFTRIVGVDFSGELCDIARRNAARYLARTGGQSRIDVVAGDVVDYKPGGEERVFFLFNPFDAVVMERVLSGIERSLADHPRTVWIVYYNPVQRAALERSGFLETAFEETIGGREFVVYRGGPVNDGPE